MLSESKQRERALEESKLPSLDLPLTHTKTEESNASVTTHSNAAVNAIQVHNNHGNNHTHPHNNNNKDNNKDTNNCHSSSSKHARIESLKNIPSQSVADYYCGHQDFMTLTTSPCSDESENAAPSSETPSTPTITSSQIMTMLNQSSSSPMNIIHSKSCPTMVVPTTTTTASSFSHDDDNSTTMNYSSPPPTGRNEMVSPSSSPTSACGSSSYSYPSPPSSPSHVSVQQQQTSAWKRFGLLRRKKSQEPLANTHNSPSSTRVDHDDYGNSNSPSSIKSLGSDHALSSFSKKQNSNHNSSTTNVANTSIQHDLNDYLFSYDAVLENSEACNLFLQYLNEKRSPESLLFMMSVKELRKCFHSMTSIVAAATSSYDTISNNSNNCESALSSSLGSNGSNHHGLDTFSSNSNTSQTTPPLLHHHHHVLNSNSLPHLRNMLRMIEEMDSKYFNSFSNIELNLPLHLHEPFSKLMEEFELKKDKFMNGTGSNGRSHHGSTEDSLEEEIYAIIKRFMSEFKRIENYLSLNLKDAQFQEFVEWNEFKTLVQTKGFAFLNSIAELKPFSHTSFVESLTEMNIPRITVKQCKLIKNMMLKNNSLWNTLISKPNYTVSLSNNQYLLGNEATSSTNGGVQFFKYDIIFPYPKSAVINTLLSTKMRFKFDKNTKVLSKIDYQPRQDEEYLATTITQEVYAFPFPFQAREFVLACSLVNDSTDQCTMLCVRSCESDKAAPLKRTVFAVNIGGWVFQDLPGSQCRFIQFVGADFRGLLPKSLVTKNISKRARYYYADTLKLFEANRKEGFPEPNDDPIFESFMNTLKENGTIAL